VKAKAEVQVSEIGRVVVDIHRNIRGRGNWDACFVIAVVYERMTPRIVEWRLS